LEEREKTQRMNEVVPISPALQGAGYLMSIYIVFNHAGGESVGDFGFGDLVKARTMYMHVMLFIMLGGLSMSVTLRGMELTNYRAWYISQFAGLYPVYIFGFLLAMIHWFSWCNDPNDFPEFTYDPTTRCMQPYAGLDFGWSSFFTIFAYIFGLQSFPGMVYLINFIYPYSWFMSIYFFLVLIFPPVYNMFARDPWNTPWHCLKIIIAEVIMMGVGCVYYACESYECRTHWTMHFWLTPFFWVPLFSGGIGIYFTMKYVHTFHRSWNSPDIWDAITDGISALMLLMLIFLVVARKQFGFEQESNNMFPRWWGIQMTHFWTPLLFLWLYGISIGSGYVARFCATDYMLKLSGTSYGVFLFHDSIINWWMLISRQEHFNGSRPYWFFTPQPADVSWPEYIGIVVVATLFAWFFFQYINPILFGWYMQATACLQDGDLKEALQEAVEIAVLNIYSETYGQPMTGNELLIDIFNGSLVEKLIANKLTILYGSLNADLDFMELHMIKMAEGTIDDVAKKIQEKIDENNAKMDVRPDFAQGDQTMHQDGPYLRGTSLREHQTVVAFDVGEEELSIHDCTPAEMLAASSQVMKTERSVSRKLAQTPDVARSISTGIGRFTVRSASRSKRSGSGLVGPTAIVHPMFADDAENVPEEYDVDHIMKTKHSGKLSDVFSAKTPTQRMRRCISSGDVLKMTPGLSDKYDYVVEDEFSEIPV